MTTNRVDTLGLGGWLLGGVVVLGTSPDASEVQVLELQAEAASDEVKIERARPREARARGDAIDELGAAPAVDELDVAPVIADVDAEEA